MFHSLLYPTWTLHLFGSSLLRERLVMKIMNFESGHGRYGIGWWTRVKFDSSHWSVLVYTLISVPPGYSMVLANEPCSPICNVPSSWKVSALCWLSSCLRLILQVPCRSGSLLWPQAAYSAVYRFVPRTDNINFGFAIRLQLYIVDTRLVLNGDLPLLSV